MMLDSQALLAEMGLGVGAAADPELADLADALAYPLRMGGQELTPEAAANVQKETGLPAAMIAGLTGWAMNSAAKGLRDAPDAEGWEYVARLVSAISRVKSWEAGSVADGIFTRLTDIRADLYQRAMGGQTPLGVDQAADLADPEPGPEPEPPSGEDEVGTTDMFDGLPDPQ